MSERNRGVVQAIYLSPAKALPMHPVESVVAEEGQGLIGDRYFGTRHRHVSVQSIEDLVIAAEAFGAPIPHDLTRRNITVTGFEIPTTPGDRITIDDVLLEVVRIAAPCKLMDDDIGIGARRALSRRGGTIFRILNGGTIRVGAPIARTETTPAI